MSRITISPSQIKTLRECDRKWYLDKVLKHPRATHPAAQFGTDVHSVMEVYVAALLDGTSPDDVFEAAISQDIDTRIVEVAQAMAKYLPTVDPTARIEPTVVTPPLHGVIINGRIDLEESGLPRITDWKTCSSFRYIPSQEELRGDPQKIIYSKHLTDLVSGPIQYRHVYASTKQIGQSIEVKLSVDVDRNDDQYAALAPEVKKTLEWRELPLIEIPPNKNACDNYGGCPYRQECYKTMSKDNMFAKIVARKKALQAKAKKGEASDILPTSGKSVMVSKKSDCFKFVADKLNVSLVFVASLANKNELSKKEVQEQTRRVMTGDGPHIWEPVGPVLITPDPEPAQVTHWEKEPMPGVAEAVEGEMEALVDEVTQPVEEESPASRYAMMGLIGNGGEIDVPVLAPAIVKTSVLYIDCMPQSQTPVFSDLIKPITDAITEEEGVFWGAMPYNQGPGLAAGLLEKSGTIPHTLFVSTRHPAAGACIPVLEPHFDVVVRRVG